MRVRNAVLLSLLVSAAAAIPVGSEAGTSMSSAWLHMTNDQDTCISKGRAAIRSENFTTNFEVLGNSSIYGERGDYTALVRCASDREIVYFVVAGPKGPICSKHMNAIRDSF